MGENNPLLMAGLGWEEQRGGGDPSCMGGAPRLRAKHGSGVIKGLKGKWGSSGGWGSWVWAGRQGRTLGAAEPRWLWSGCAWGWENEPEHPAGHRGTPWEHEG